jgi:hypothetical protein
VVNNTEAASPIPLPNASRIAVIIPGDACLINILNEISDRVEPNAEDASNNHPLTLP